MKQKAVFLDRDGVLNKAIIKNGKPYPPASLYELIIPDDVPLALELLKKAGFLLIGATNQPDVARGTTNQVTVEQINNRLLELLPLDDIRVCFHDDKDQCNCRKPLPGLLMNAAIKFEINLANSFMIGDRWKDVQAGKQAGCKTIWLDYKYQEPYLAEPANYVTNSFSDAVKWILKIN